MCLHTHTHIRTNKQLKIFLQGEGKGRKEEGGWLDCKKKGESLDVKVEGTDLWCEACPATRGDGEILILAAAEGHVWVHGHAAAGVCVDVSYYH